MAAEAGCLTHQRTPHPTVTQLPFPQPDFHLLIFNTNTYLRFKAYHVYILSFIYLHLIQVLKAAL